MKKKWGILGLGIVCFLGMMAHAWWGFENGSIQVYTESKLSELKKTAELNAESIQKEYIEKINVLSGLAEKVEQKSYKSVEGLKQGVQILLGLGLFDYVGIADARGIGIDSGGSQVDIGEREYFKKVMNGEEAAISEVLASKIVEGDEVQIIAVPIKKEEKVVGVLYGVHNIKIVNETLENTSGSFIYTKIVDGNGKPVTILENDEWLAGYDNLWDFYQQCEFTSGSMEEIKENTENQKSGYYQLSYGNEKRMTYYAPLKVEGYYIYSNLDMSLIDNLTKEINKKAVHLVVDISIALLLLVSAVFWIIKKTSVELQKAYEKAVSNEKMMRIAIMNSDLEVFEYDQKRGVIERKSKERHLLFPDIITRNVPEMIEKNEVIQEKFLSPLEDAFERIKWEENAAVTIQTKAEYQSLWFTIFMQNIYDEKHRIINTVGSIKNVTYVKEQEEKLQREKKNQASLKIKAERDGLTGLYNGTTAIEKINKLLKGREDTDGKQLFVFMDLDNFKKINDVFGHQFGNQVIIEMSEIFAKKFRSSDIVGRFGGDEFFAFLMDTKGFGKMEHIFRELVNECNKTYEKDGVSVQVSASFGIAVAPDHGTTFEELSQKADEMLFEVKRDKKNGYKLYPGK